MKCNLRLPLQYGAGFCDSVAALVAEKGNPVAAEPWRCSGADKMRGNLGEEPDGVGEPVGNALGDGRRANESGNCVKKVRLSDRLGIDKIECFADGGGIVGGENASAGNILNME